MVCSDKRSTEKPDNTKYAYFFALKIFLKYKVKIKLRTVSKHYRLVKKDKKIYLGILFSKVMFYKVEDSIYLTQIELIASNKR